MEEKTASNTGETSKRQDVEETNDPPFAVTTEVTEKGFPITKDGRDVFKHMLREQDNRDQDLHGVYLYNDWNGWGATEVLENAVSF